MNQPKSIFITGGAKGIGRVSARSLISAGHKVAIADNDRSAGQELADELERKGDFIFIHADITEDDAVQRSIEKAVRFHDGIDVLVNNAGISINKPLEQLSLDEWRKVMDTNLTAAFLFAKYTAAHLRARKGCIVNLCSTRALMSEADTEAYSASKGGILALTHAMAISLGPHIRVNCISPGWIDVSKHQSSRNGEGADLSEQDHKQHPAGRVGEADDIARMIHFLIDDSNDFITGQNFIIDGGMTRKMIYD
jgi:NAD(P)-dependent dehydrogenase (short-subunit alcohol dehydrogenase family)